LSTHALAVTGTGGTAALAVTQIGADLSLPAGGPWTIHGVWGQVAKVTAAADEGSGGALILNSVSGDVAPDPAPGRWPLIGSPAASSAAFTIASIPLNIFQTRLEAAGKATINLSYLQQLAITTASYCAAGILFGDSIPEPVRAPFCDSVRASFASSAESAIGTITLAEKATKIVGILADLNKGDAITVAEPIIGTIRLDSSDIKLPPAQYPMNRCFDSALGTLAGAVDVGQSQFIPVDIPVMGGARIDVFATTPVSVTGNADVQVFIAYQ
jgi:hypothetical protein